MKLFVKTVLLAGLFSFSAQAFNKWVEPMSLNVQNGSLQDVLRQLSMATGIPVDMAEGMSNIKLNSLVIKNQSASHILSILEEMYNLKIERTSKLGFRVGFAQKQDLHRLDLDPGEANVDVIFRDTPSEEVLQTLQKVLDINMVVPTFVNHGKFTYKGSFSPTSLINEVAGIEGFDVHKRDGTIYFTRPSNK